MINIKKLLKILQEEFPDRPKNEIEKTLRNRIIFYSNQNKTELHIESIVLKEVKNILNTK